MLYFGAEGTFFRKKIVLPLSHIFSSPDNSLILRQFLYENCQFACYISEKLLFHDIFCQKNQILEIIGVAKSEKLLVSQPLATPDIRHWGGARYFSFSRGCHPLHPDSSAPVLLPQFIVNPIRNFRGVYCSSS